MLFLNKFICRKRNHEDSDDDKNVFVPKSSVESDSPTTDNEMRNYLLDGKYFKINSVNGTRMNVTCQNCSKQIIAYSNSTGNL